MERSRICLSTIAADAAQVAREYGLGLEIAEYCTAWNMDDAFAETDAQVRKQLVGVNARVLHAPFNELFPCAIDRRARALAAMRYRQAAELAHHYGAEKLVVHGGYDPHLYYPVWYVEQSVTFWQTFLQMDPGVEIVLENVLEEEPDMLLEIVRAVGNPRLRLCLDVGHVNAYGEKDVWEWLRVCEPYLSHFHIHNNDGTKDTHNAPNQGSISMGIWLREAEVRCPQATFTLEVPEAAPAVQWLMEEGICSCGSSSSRLDR